MSRTKDKGRSMSGIAVSIGRLMLVVAMLSFFSLIGAHEAQGATYRELGWINAKRVTYGFDIILGYEQRTGDFSESTQFTQHYKFNINGCILDPRLASYKGSLGFKYAMADGDKADSRLATADISIAMFNGINRNRGHWMFRYVPSPMFISYGISRSDIYISNVFSMNMLYTLPGYLNFLEQGKFVSYDNGLSRKRTLNNTVNVNRYRIKYVESERNWNRNGEGNWNRNGEGNGNRNGEGNWNRNGNGNWNRNGNGNRNGEGNWNRNGNGNWNRNGNGNRNGEGNWNRNGNGNWNRNGNGNWNRNGNGNWNRNGNGNWNRNGNGDSNRNGDGNWNRNGNGNWNRNGNGDSNRNGDGNWNRNGSGNSNPEDAPSTNKEQGQEESNWSRYTVQNLFQSRDGASGLRVRFPLFVLGVNKTSTELVDNNDKSTSFTANFHISIPQHTDNTDGKLSLSAYQFTYKYVNLNDDNKRSEVIADGFRRWDYFKVSAMLSNLSQEGSNYQTRDTQRLQVSLYFNDNWRLSSKESLATKDQKYPGKMFQMPVVLGGTVSAVLQKDTASDLDYYLSMDGVGSYDKGVNHYLMPGVTAQSRFGAALRQSRMLTAGGGLTGEFKRGDFRMTFDEELRYLRIRGYEGRALFSTNYYNEAKVLPLEFKASLKSGKNKFEVRFRSSYVVPLSDGMGSSSIYGVGLSKGFELTYTIAASVSADAERGTSSDEGDLNKDSSATSYAGQANLDWRVSPYESVRALCKYTSTELDTFVRYSVNARSANFMGGMLGLNYDYSKRGIDAGATQRAVASYSKNYRRLSLGFSYDHLQYPSGLVDNIWRVSASRSIYRML